MASADCNSPHRQGPPPSHYTPIFQTPPQASQPPSPRIPATSLPTNRPQSSAQKLPPDHTKQSGDMSEVTLCETTPSETQHADEHPPRGGATAVSYKYWGSMASTYPLANLPVDMDILPLLLSSGLPICSIPRLWKGGEYTAILHPAWGSREGSMGGFQRISGASRSMTVPFPM